MMLEGTGHEGRDIEDWHFIVNRLDAIRQKCVIPHGLGGWAKAGMTLHSSPRASPHVPQATTKTLASSSTAPPPNSTTFSTPNSPAPPTPPATPNAPQPKRLQRRQRLHMRLRPSHPAKQHLGHLQLYLCRARRHHLRRGGPAGESM